MHVLGSLVILGAAWASGAPRDAIIALLISVLAHGFIAVFLSD